MVETTDKTQHFISPDFLQPHLSTKLYRTTFNYLKSFYSERIFDEICVELKIPKEYLLSDDNWVSVEFGRRFASLVRHKTNDRNVYEKIGHFFFDPQNINPIEYKILKTFSPFGFFKVLPRFYKRTNQACDLEVKGEGFGKYSIRIRALEGTVYSDMVLNTLGVLQGLENFYGLKGFSIQLHDAIKPGEEVSEFELNLEFAPLRYFFDRFAGLFSAVSVGALAGYALYNWEMRVGLKVLPILTTAIVLLGLLAYRLNSTLSVLKKNIELYYEKSREKNFQLYQKSELLDRRYNEANLLRELSTELVTIKDSQKVLQVCLDSLNSRFDMQQVALFLVSKKRKKLFLAESRGLSDLQAKVGEVEFDFPNPKAKEGLFASILENGESVLINEVDTYKKSLQQKNQMLLDLLKIDSMVVCPIQTNDEKYGLLVLFSPKGTIQFTTADQFLGEKICNFLALYLDNASNFEKELNLRTIFQQYVPPIVIEEFVRDGNSLEVAPKRAEIISVFIDLRDFTSLSEKFAPEKVVQIISRYADFISSIFSRHGAVIDNIVGDAVVIFFPCTGEGIADAKRLFNALREIDQKWDEIQASMSNLGLMSFKLGVGVHVGAALVGNVGGSIKRNYTALGDTVNIASRLQTLSKKFPAEMGKGNLTVLVSKEVFEKANQFPKQFLSERLRGRDEDTKFANLNPELLGNILDVEVNPSKKAG